MTPSEKTLSPLGEAIQILFRRAPRVGCGCGDHFAIAGKVMTELASTLPNVGGVVDFFAGGNDLSEHSATASEFRICLCERTSTELGIDADE